MSDLSAENVTITLPRDQATFLRRLVSSVRAFGTETDSVKLQHFFSPYDDWLEYIDQELARALARNDTNGHANEPID